MEENPASVGNLGDSSGDVIVDCIVSAVAGRIVFVDGNDVRYVEADHPTVKKMASLSELPRILAGAYDVVTLKNTTPTIAFEHFLEARNRDRALRMFDIVLDDSSDNDEIHDASECLASLLSTSTVRIWLLNRAFALPYSRASNVESLAKMLQSVPSVLEFVDHVTSHQNKIQQVRNAWDLISDSLFGDRTQRLQFEFLAVSYGAFRMLSEALGDRKAINQVLVQFSRDLGDQPNSQDVIREWTKPLKETLRKLDPITADLTSAPESYAEAGRQQDGNIRRLTSGYISQTRKFAHQLIKLHEYTFALFRQLTRKATSAWTAVAELEEATEVAGAYVSAGAARGGPSSVITTVATPQRKRLEPPVGVGRLEQLLAWHIAVEFFAIAGTCYLMGVIYFETLLAIWPSTNQYLPAALSTAPALLVVTTAFGFKHYVGVPTQSRSHFMWSGLRAVVLGFSSFLFLLFVFKFADRYSRAMFFFQFLGSGATILITRAMTHAYIRRAIASGVVGTRRALFIGDTSKCSKILDNLRQSGIRSIGAVPFPYIHGDTDSGIRAVSQNVRNFVERCRAFDPDDIFSLPWLTT